MRGGRERQGGRIGTRLPGCRGLEGGRVAFFGVRVGRRVCGRGSGRAGVAGLGVDNGDSGADVAVEPWVVRMLDRRQHAIAVDELQGKFLGAVVFEQSGRHARCRVGRGRQTLDVLVDRIDDPGLKVEVNVWVVEVVLHELVECVDQPAFSMEALRRDVDNKLLVAAHEDVRNRVVEDDHVQHGEGERYRGDGVREEHVLGRGRRRHGSR